MWDSFKGWMTRPFSADMSAAEWFLFVGLVIVIMAVWRMIFMHLKEGL
jgi:hypothetical protein